MEDNQLVSVIIPVFNYERYLAEAVESALNQTHRALEVIVVDDGSTDRSGEVAKSFAGRGVRYRLQQQAGIGPARNTGVAMAQGEYFAFLDADDRWPLNKTELQLRAFAADPGLDMAFGQAVQLHDGPEWEAGVKNQDLAGANLVPGMIPGSFIVKRSSFQRVGEFPGGMKLGEFIDWYSRAMALELRSVTLPDLCLWRRIHDSNTGVRERQSRSDYARVLKAALDRRRAEEGKSAKS